MEELRIVLLGKQGSGKSSTGNTLLGGKTFHTAASSQGVTKACAKITSTVNGQKISVVDTPGWTDFILMEEETLQEIAKCINLSEPGPHVFLLVIPIGRFTKEEIDTVQQILEVFGEEARKYTMVLFTRGDDLEEQTIKEYLEGVHPDLKKILQDCGGRYHVFNNRENGNPRQVFTLLEKIKHVVKSNKGEHYTKEMYQKTADLMKEKWKRVKLSKAFMEQEYRRQIRNSAVGLNDETKIRKGLEHNSNMKRAVPERRHSTVHTPYCTPSLNYGMAVKQNEDNKLSYRKTLHDREYHNQEFKPNGEAEQQPSNEMLVDLVKKLSNELNQVKREVEHLERELNEVKFGQQQKTECDRTGREERRGRKVKQNWCFWKHL